MSAGVGIVTEFGKQYSVIIGQGIIIFLTILHQSLTYIEQGVLQPYRDFREPMKQLNLRNYTKMWIYFHL